jgi:hypothetical protein
MYFFSFNVCRIHQSKVSKEVQLLPSSNMPSSFANGRELCQLPPFYSLRAVFCASHSFYGGGNSFSFCAGTIFTLTATALVQCTPKKKERGEERERRQEKCKKGYLNQLCVRLHSIPPCRPSGWSGGQAGGHAGGPR